MHRAFLKRHISTISLARGIWTHKGADTRLRGGRRFPEPGLGSLAPTTKLGQNGIEDDLSQPRSTALIPVKQTYHAAADLAEYKHINTAPSQLNSLHHPLPFLSRSTAPFNAVAPFVRDCYTTAWSLEVSSWGLLNGASAGHRKYLCGDCYTTLPATGSILAGL